MSVLPDGWESWEEHDKQYVREYGKLPTILKSHIQNYGICTCCGTTGNSSGAALLGLGEASYITVKKVEKESILPLYLAHGQGSKLAESLVIRDPSGDVQIFWADA